MAIPVNEPSRVAEVRRSAAALAREEGLDETLSSQVAIVATEMGTNLLKHAQQGEIFLSKLSDRNTPGVELLSVDRGPGIADLGRCLKDGFSTKGTPGTGLGAIMRLSRDFDIYSERGKGTVMVSRITAATGTDGVVHRERASVGVVLKPITGESVAGDNWAVAEDESGMALLVADGLGHGVLAARASAEAVAAFRRSHEYAPVPVLTRVHGALRGTRGAAVALARLERGASEVRYAGIGNISGVITQPEAKPVVMISHNGTAGFHTPRLQEFRYPLPGEAVLIMHSDGLTSSWSLDEHPGLLRRHPSVIAGVLYRDASRNRDDVCVVVARLGRAA